MKLLITGGCGFIGTNIAYEAHRRGYKVICFDSFIRPRSEENIEFLSKHGIEIIRGDVRNTEDFFRIGSVDAIIHLAANPGIPWSIQWPDYDFNVNAVGTINALEYARSLGKIPFIFASTNKVYSDKINDLELYENKTRYFWANRLFEGIREDFPIDGFGKYSHSPYGVSKIAGDLLCQEYHHAYGVKTVVNRMSCIYGYFQKGVEDQGWIDWFVRCIGFGDGKISIYGDGKQVRDMLWGEDVAKLYLDEIENIKKTAGQVFNVGGGMGNTLSLQEAITEIEAVTGKKAHITYKEWRHADQRVYVSDIGKVTKLLNWKPKVSPQEGIRKMYERYKENL